MKFDFFGKEIEVGLDHLGTIILAMLLTGVIIVGWTYLSSYLQDAGPDEIVLIANMGNLVIVSGRNLLFAVFLFLVENKKVSRERAKSLCGGYVLLAVALSLLMLLVSYAGLVPYEYRATDAMQGVPYEYRATDAMYDMLYAFFTAAILFIWLTIFGQWNGKKITQAVRTGVALAALSSIIIVAFTYFFYLSIGIVQDIYLPLLAYFVYLSFLAVPLVYYLVDKKTLDNRDCFFGVMLILSGIVAFKTGGMDYGIIGLFVVYLWWLQKKK